MANPIPPKTLPKGNAALIIGHPGHELRIHHWVETVHPLTVVLTDGSGRGQQSRLASTLNVLHRAGAKPATIFGRWTDAQAYEILLSGNLDALIGVTKELAQTIATNDIEIVVADAMEGFNPTHDLCRYLTNAAVLRAARETGRKIANFDFTLVGPPDAAPAEIRDQCIRLQLDDAALARKRIAAENYPELKEEVDAAISQFGLQLFATELLRPVTAHFLTACADRPFYETHGENRVKEGHYDQVIRSRENVLPLMQALWRELDLPA
ncbi:MAG TPA: hypothetical protein VE031_07840 [Chthoniobacterales bacterium]|nr:hypothetical protein [Chthoniobacterales bacterium]